MVASTLLVQQDLSGTAFGAAFVPTDVTRFVRLIDGVNINSWRQDAASQISPSTLSLTFDNDAIPGDATAPNAGRFTPGLSSSPWSGKILPGVRTRITETVGGTAYQLFDGYVLDWTAQPGGDDGTFPVVQVSCTDALGWMGILQPLRSILAEEMLADSPSFYYQLSEAQGATTFGDITAKQPGAPLTSSKYGGAPAAAGASISAPAPLAAAGSAVSFTNSVAAHGAQTVVALPSSCAVPLNQFTFECWFSTTTTTTNAQTLIALGDGRGNIFGLYTIGTTVGMYLPGGPFVSATVAVNDGVWRHLACTSDGATTTVYLNGQVVATFVGAFASAWTPRGGAIGGSLDYTAGSLFGFTGSLAHCAGYPTALSAARILAHYTAGATTFAGERTDQRASRLLGYRPNTGSVLDVGKGAAGIQNTEGVTLQQALLDVGKAEGGLVFADGQGRVVLLNRAHLYDPAASSTFDSEADLTSDYQARIDTQQLVNDMTVSRPVGADQRVVDATSKSAYGWRQQSDTYVVNSDRDAADAAGWLVVNQKTAAVRTPSIAIDITTMTSTSQAQAAMARQPLDRVTLSNLPAWAPPTDVLVQGRNVRIDDKGLSLAFFTSPVARKTLRADAAASANTKLDNGLVIPW